MTIRKNISLYFVMIISLLGCTNNSKTLKLTIKHQETNRTAIVEMQNVVSAHKRCPLLIVLHGHNENADFIRYRIKNTRIFIENGVKIVYPNGSGSLLKNWNNTEREISFLKALIDTLTLKYNVDKGKVYVAGFSQGGQLAYKLVCTYPQIFNAIAMVASSIDAEYIHKNCNKTLVPLISINSKVDPACPIDSFTYKGNWFNSVESGLRSYANSSENNAEEKTVNISQYITIKKWISKDCVNVVLYITKDGGHGWPKGNGLFLIPHFQPSNNIDASKIIYEFFFHECIKNEKTGI